MLVFQERLKTAEMQKKIGAVYGEGAVTDKMCQVICKVSWYY